MSSKTTRCCLLTLKDVCEDLYDWSTIWRMIINCEPEKTELCFAAAEKDKSSFQLGNNCMKFVEKTKVLGLVMIENLCYVDHGKKIYTDGYVSANRNWGIRQHVIVQLLEVLIGACICYAGIV